MPDFMPAAAEIFLISGICVVLLVDVFLPEKQRRVTFQLALLTS